MYPYVVEVVFRLNKGCMSRLLRSKAPLTTQQVKSFYTKFCRFNNCNFDLVVNVTNISLAKNLVIDTYTGAGDYYTSKALLYAESYGIVSYKVKGNLLIYNQNYSNKECIGGSWVENPCTYQRTVDLDSGEVITKKLQRLQKDGWDNV